MLYDNIILFVFFTGEPYVSELCINLIWKCLFQSTYLSFISLLLNQNYKILFWKTQK